MKKIIIRTIAIVLVFSFLLAGSILSNAGDSAAGTTTASAAATEVLDPVKLFPLTLTPEELLSVLADHEIEIILPDDPSSYYIIGEDGRLYDSTLYHFWYVCEGIEFVFCEEVIDDAKMSHFEVSGDRFATPEGIRIGDSRCKVIRTYRKIGILRDAKTEDGYYRFYFGGKRKRCGPLDSWKFYNDNLCTSYHYSG